ncbi:MAG: carboxylesterase family protein, partial [Proteobacteria bacterium]|nr:carboxylesterase family protein [Pseudomonadota bacterium]
MVTLPQGRFQGRAGDGYNAFSGIPYAEPPVGERRWRPPEPRKRGVPFS